MEFQGVHQKLRKKIEEKTWIARGVNAKKSISSTRRGGVQFFFWKITLLAVISNFLEGIELGTFPS